MAIGMNKVELMGNIVKDAVFSTSANGTAVARYTIAVNRRKDKNGISVADFIPCVSFGKGAEFAEKYFKKGTSVAIVGSIQTGSYEKDGQKIYTTNVVVNETYFTGSKKEEVLTSEANTPKNTETKKSDTTPEPPAKEKSARKGWKKKAVSIPEGFIPIPDGVDSDIPF